MYSRKIDGQTLTLAPSGWTYDRTFVFLDFETNTLWFPYRKGLKGIQGRYFGRWLPIVDFTDTTWKRWKESNPGSLILK